MLLLIILIIISCTAACALLWKKQQRPQGEPKGFILIPCTGSSEDLELLVKSAYWGEMLESEETRRRILIVTVDAGQNLFTARRLAAELSNVETVDITALEDRIRRDV